MNAKEAQVLVEPPTPLLAMGAALRARRKALGLSSTATAEAAGISRVTLHRVEKGEPGVAAGAYANVARAIGLTMAVNPETLVRLDADLREGWIPARIRLEDYPQLKTLAWQVHGVDALTPLEALGIYKRNKRHLDEKKLIARERALIDALTLALDHDIANL
jgi:transcriptional regulator with XRE-family HTH domain